VCYFATDIHSKTLALGKNDDSLERAGDIKGETIKPKRKTTEKKDLNIPLASHP
jgi:hypothetical protein